MAAAVMQVSNEHLDRLRSVKSRIPRLAVERCGVPPSWVGYRWWQRESLRQHAERVGRMRELQQVHEPRVHHAPLPRNVDARESLIDRRGWWGFSFRDVPQRECGETLLGTVGDCRVVHFHQPPGHTFAGDHYVGILTGDQRALELREIRLHDQHAARLRAGGREERHAEATWVVERVWHNYSHWLSAHLPKFVLLQQHGLLDDVLLPTVLPPAHEASLRRLGLDPAAFRRFDPAATQRIERMHIMESDRFRPELVTSVRAAMAPPGTVTPWRRVYISRARATRRVLRNEQQIAGMLHRFGFEPVVMEDLDFDAQVELMAETRVLVAPHGAGLTNMIFCAPGTHIVEIANLDFPNPNFYALAAALGLEYWLVPGRAAGEGHPLFSDIVGDEAELARILPLLIDAALPAGRGSTQPTGRVAVPGKGNDMRPAVPGGAAQQVAVPAAGDPGASFQPGLVSVVVPCYNKAEFVAETLDSVLAQEDVPFEVVVVDDVSSDGSYDVITRYEDRVAVHRMATNAGSTATRRHGASLARGEYIMFLDADDVLEPGTLRALRDALAGSTDAVAAVPWRKLHREGDGWVPRDSGKALEPPGDDPVAAWLGSWYYPPCAVLWARVAYDAVGGWGEAGPWDDRELMIRALLRGVRIIAAPDGGALYRILEEGASLRSLPTEAATASRIRALDSIAALAGELDVIDHYRRPLGLAYFRLAHEQASTHPQLMLECLARADEYLGRTPISGSPAHRALWRVMGLERKERLARWLASRRLISRTTAGADATAT
jgi:capsular polysaccharide biosynthesis protein/GT2 family glycosyltransferase